MSGTACSNSMMNGLRPNSHRSHQQHQEKQSCSFQMPLHYPRYKKSDYESMPEWKLDCLLSQYGLSVSGDISHKRNFAMGAFLWPSQNS
ncbi:hypothetical protein LOK49_LG11G02776 [Camellia lanceoleosa]|uniref:Uncharacterized protein n=2 Tax=Camellia lanceoleosa TaxID=1840588 RepID=A0ACC0G2V5_9ERIC|nr:hypothetical protein LOK49_LG11G02766 [Camellia lanceoleosa]KAI7994672.1 hypothetical protein LOK49_LG11G02776 [Camellia lanceoleosa]